MLPRLRGTIGAALLCALFTHYSNAQSLFHDTAYHYKADLTSVQGREFWFAPPALFAVPSGKYYELCISAQKNTTVHVVCGSWQTTAAVKAGITTAISLPLTQELKTSGIVEKKAYHVWSDDADLDVILAADIPSQAGDVMHILPTYALGTDYVVASYPALFMGGGNSQYDYPSEFTIVAQHDSTVVTILPSTDMRQETEIVPSPDHIAYAHGQQFTVELHRGLAVQYKTVTSQSPDYDVSGTVIHSTYPVAVIGASMRAYVPVGYPHFDYVADMVPPIRSWGKTYYSMPFYQPAGVSNHDASSFLIIGTKAGQNIYRYDQASGDQVLALLDKPYDISYAPDISKPSLWHSDAPFLLVQYINSATYPDSLLKAKGTPAMMVLPPVEEFGTTATLQPPLKTATFNSDIAMYVNIIASDDATTVTFDGQRINSWYKRPIDGKYSIYRGVSVAQGPHVVKSDKPVGVYAYGYSNATSGESIGYPAQNGLIALPGSDTTGPTIAWENGTGCGHATIRDEVSGLSHFRVDTIANMTSTRDTLYMAGDSTRETYLDACLIDAGKNGFLRLTAFDMAGNRSVSEFTYTAPTSTTLKPGFTLAASSFDTVRVGTTKTLALAILTDTSSIWPITFDSIWTDNAAFTSYQNGLPLTLLPGSSDTLGISFTPTKNNIYSAFLYAHSPSVGTQKAALHGSGYSSDAVSTPVDDPSAWLASGSGNLFLLPPSPNPTSSELSIAYALRSTSTVWFGLYSCTGELVYSWKEAAQQAGIHSQTFNLNALPNGGYFYRLEANGESKIGKIAVKRRK